MTSWMTGIGEDLISCKSLHKFRDIKSLAKSYVELEKQFDRRVPLPNVDSDDKDWDKFFKAAGLPEDGKYLSDKIRTELLKDGANKDVLSTYEMIFYRSGLTKRQGTRLIDNLHILSKETGAIKQGHVVQTKTQNSETLSEKYTIPEYAIPELAELTDLLVKVTELLQSHSLIFGKLKTSAGSKEAVFAGNKKA